MKSLKYLEDKWDINYAASLSDEEKLKYRSNLLGADLRITNYGGGNTSSKIIMSDPISEEDVEILWVKGSGGDLGSINISGFARLYMNKFLQLSKKYKGVNFEDEMVSYYPLCSFGLNGAPASIDTPLHGLIPFKHVDHLHPDWATSVAASANGERRLSEFNDQFNKNILWIPWRRPGYELGKMLERAISKNPNAEGAILASHGLISWADDHYQCYRNSIEIIDAFGQFVSSFKNKVGKKIFGGLKINTKKKLENIKEEIIPLIRGMVSGKTRFIAHYSNDKDVMRFINSNDAEKLSFKGTSCPDHFLRTKIRPFIVQWDPQTDSIKTLKQKIISGILRYRKDYEKYYKVNKEKNSPKMRDSNPTVVLIPGIGMLSFGKNKKEARITGEFFINAIHVMEGATALNSGNYDLNIKTKNVVNNYFALNEKEAFRIEYWQLEEAKLRRQPPEKEFARKIAIVVGGGSGIGKEFCSKLVSEGAHIAICDLNLNSAQKTQNEIAQKFGDEISIALYVDITDRTSVKNMIEKVVLHFGGIDVLVNTAAIFLPPDNGTFYKDETWEKILRINITGNNILAEEFTRILEIQNLKGDLLLTSSANAVVAKHGSEPYDVSKTALNHLIRELSVRFAKRLRINGVSPATVVEGSSMFPRDRVISSLTKYKVSFEKTDLTESLMEKLADFYSQRTLTHLPIRPIDIVEAGYFLISPRATRTTGHIFPVDGGLIEAFLR